MMNYTFNVYTVHDCFIAPAPKAKAGGLSCIYCVCLADMIHPHNQQIAGV